MTRRITIVEDEPAIRENYADVFRRHGYEVSTYADRTSALAALRQRLPDLAILDIGLGDEIEGGFDLCRQLRQLSASLPIIFLTARDSDLDTISGLRLGADDYLTKDISLSHLTARIAALFRRTEALRTVNEPDECLQRGPLQLDLNRVCVHWDGQRMELSLTEFWLVHALVKFPGHVKSREQLMDEANLVVDGDTITSHIKRIRRKFTLLEPAFQSIETVYGMGYRWRPDG